MTSDSRNRNRRELLEVSIVRGPGDGLVSQAMVVVLDLAKFTNHKRLVSMVHP